MSKLIKKLPILFASFAMAMGVGLVGSKDAANVKADVGNKIYESGTPNWGTSYGYGNQTLNGVDWYVTTYGGFTNGFGWNTATQNKTSSADLGPISNITAESTKYGFYQSSGAFSNAQKFDLSISNSDSVTGSYYVFYSTDNGSSWITAVKGTLSGTTSSISYDHGSKIGDSVFFAVGIGTSKTTKTRILINSIEVYAAGVEKKVASVTGVESYPEEVFEGDTINGEDVELSVLYDNGESGTEPAHHVDVDTSSLGTTTATAYYDADGKMFATFEVTVIEKPDALIFESNDVVNGTAYGEHSNDDWLLTIGGYNMACGSNGKKGDYTADKYADGKLVTSSTLAFVIATRNALSNVGKMTFTYGSGNGYSIGKMYLTYSTDNENYALVELTNTSVSTQGMSVGEPDTDYVFEFDPIESAAYYAIIVAGPTSATTTFRFDYVVAALYSFKVANPVDDVIALIDAIGEITYENYKEKEDALLEAWLAYEALSPEEQESVTNADVLLAAQDKQENYEKVDKFIADWHSMRTNGTRGICEYDLNGENALTDLLNRFEGFDGEYKDLIINAIDVEKENITIGQTMDYINNVLKKEATVSEDHNLSSFIISLGDNTTSLVALFAILGLVAVSAYYFIEKRKLAK